MLFWLVAGCSLASTNPAQASESALEERGSDSLTNTDLISEKYGGSQSKEHKLAIGDIVKIFVLGYPRTIVDNLPIAPDGKLYYMLSKPIEAKGRYASEVEEDLARELSKMFSEPQVAVLPQKLSTSRYFVYGKVENPGVYPLNRRLTLRDAIAHAGGLAQGVYRGSTVDIASLRNSYVLRGDEKLGVDFKTLLDDYRDSKNNPYIRPGDIIHIASGLGANKEIYLLGAVNEQKPVAYKDDMTLIEVLSGGSQRGGGLSDEAYQKQILIVRGSLKSPETFEVDLDAILHGQARNIYLMPGDIVYVPDKPFQFLRELSFQAISVFTKTFSAEFGSAVVDEAFTPSQNTN